MKKEGVDDKEGAREERKHEGGNREKRKNDGKAARRR